MNFSSRLSSSSAEASEAADLLGFHEDDITMLVRQKLIEPLSEPGHNAVKDFALVDLEELGWGRMDCRLARNPFIAGVGGNLARVAHKR